MKSSEAILPRPEAANRGREELAFLPASLEIVETPPSPLGRSIGATIVALFCLTVAWAYLGTVDIVATAPGKIVPTGRSKVVQPVEIAVVRAIHVRDGQSVKAGEVLIELDPTMSEAERDHLQGDLFGTQLDAARLRAALSDAADPVTEFHPPAGESAALVATQRQFLLDMVAEQRTKLAVLDRQRVQKEAEVGTISAVIARTEAVIPLLQQQLNIRETLYEHETGSKLLYLQTLQQLVEQKQNLAVQQSNLREAQAAVAAIIESRGQAVIEFRRALFDELAKAEQKAMGLSQDVLRAEQRTRFQLLTAPVDGVVQQLAVHSVGAVVTPAQSLLVLVPTESRLEIEAAIANDDVGFVHVGQDAQIKVAAFNFTRYGLLHGKIVSVSADAIASSAQPDQSSAESGKGASADRQPAYAARVSLDRSQIGVEDKLVNLSPGMAVTVEIATGSRSIMSYLLSPLRAYRQESLRER